MKKEKVEIIKCESIIAEFDYHNKHFQIQELVEVYKEIRLSIVSRYLLWEHRGKNRHLIIHDFDVSLKQAAIDTYINDCFKQERERNDLDNYKFVNRSHLDSKKF